MKHTVIIDYGHIFHACRSVALQTVSSHNLIDSTVFHILGKLRTHHRILSGMGIPLYDLIFAEDRIATRKLSLLPGYRAGRISRTEEKLEVKAMLKTRGCEGFWCSSEGNEADDVIATLDFMAKGQGISSIIITGDRDLWQLIGDTTVVINPIKKELVSFEDIHKAFKVGPRHISLVKSFWGDSGDCVPNVIPRMQKHLLPIIRESDGSFDDCHSKILEQRERLDKKCIKLYDEQESNARRNYSLVKLDTSCSLIWD